ncbi:MAG: hypothetical protein ACTS6J_15855 [Burkholderiales bacterium]
MYLLLRNIYNQYIKTINYENYSYNFPCRGMLFHEIRAPQQGAFVPSWVGAVKARREAE